MNLKSMERLENNKVQLEIQVEKEEFETAVNKSYRKNVGKINIPGFRKGKAPRKIIERMYGKEFFYDDAVNFALPDAYESAITEKDIQPVSEPELELLEIDENGFSFKAAIFVKPEVTLGEYKGLTVDKLEVNVTENDIQNELNSLADRNSRLVSVERAAQNGDTVIIDFDGYVDGEAFDGGKAEGHSLKLGSGQFIPGFEEQLVGSTVGSDVVVKVTFPAEYQAEELAGKDAEFKVKVHEIKENQLPVIDDEFAKDVSENDTLDELKKSIEADLTEKRNKEADMGFEDEILNTVVSNMTVDVPDVMVEDQLNRIIDDYKNRFTQQGFTMEQYLSITQTDMDTFKNGFRDNALKQVKISLALEEICKAEKIEISESDIEDEYKKLSEQFKMPIERVKELINTEGMKSDMKSMKTLEFLRGSTKANIVKPEDIEKKIAAAKKDEPAKKAAKTTAKKPVKATAKKAKENTPTAEKNSSADKE